MKMRLVQRQFAKWTIPLCFMVAALSLGHLCVGYGLLYMVCRNLVKQDLPLHWLYTGSDRVLFFLGAAFALSGSIVAFTLLHMVFGVEMWEADDESLFRKSMLFGMTLRKRRWKLVEINQPQLNHITSRIVVGFHNPLPFSSCKSRCNDWEVSIMDKGSRRSEMIYWSGAKEPAEEFFDFLRSAMLLRSSEE